MKSMVWPQYKFYSKYSGYYQDILNEGNGNICFCVLKGHSGCFKVGINHVGKNIRELVKWIYFFLLQFCDSIKVPPEAELLIR